MILSVPELVAQAKNSVDCVSAAQAFTHKNATFIDVREPAETAASPVTNSINIPRGVLEMNIAKYCTNADMEIYLHCASGGRATLAAEQLQRIGYNNVKAISCDHNNVCLAQKNQ
ncbi:rhodanese-like domain-containing protein [Colwellia sp. MB3u-70]|uniref:rhodanese-like domain-containing protein n=1 Tax=unclassified Colwellia TaxID=196834 RepID=UPI0015F54952|nr:MULTISPECIES: rhodanese-like domain-containing protein [unclassified Colwellia]MBA6291068.1 rhodanese-like domain-containing protein [Colwellia sp. MB3u-8]MBA6308213.1 rhodanese-like domain-containing protein [Colwellia sp. MB3u-70]